MVGRFGLSDISPVVGSTSRASSPRTRVVGEPIPISARGVPRGTRRRRRERRAARPGGPQGRAVLRMTKGAPGTDRWHATVVARPTGPVDVHDRGVERPVLHLAPRRHDQDRGRPGRRGPRQRLRGRRPAVRPAAPSPAEDRAAARRRRGAALRDTDARRRPPRRAGPGRLPAGPDRSDYPVRDLVTASPRYPLWIDRTRALFGSWYEFFPRSIGAELAGDPAAPASPLRHGTFKDATEHLDYVASHGLRRRVPAADPPDRRGEPQGPEQHARRGVLGRRLAVGDRLARRRPRRDPPRARARWPTSPRS